MTHQDINCYSRHFQALIKSPYKINTSLNHRRISNRPVTPYYILLEYLKYNKTNKKEFWLKLFLEIWLNILIKYLTESSHESEIDVET